MNFNSFELPFRQEVLFLFKKCQINPNHLIFVEDLKILLKNCSKNIKNYSEISKISQKSTENLNKNAKNLEKIKIILVDHNKIYPDNFLYNYRNFVIAIFDHHKYDNDFNKIKEKIIIEKTGSCVSIIANKLIKSENFANGKNLNDLALLIVSTILLDTINFNNSIKKFNKTDFDIFNKFWPFQNYFLNKTQLYRILFAKRNDISKLSLPQILSKDAKSISPGVFGGKIKKVILSSVPSCFSELINRFGLESFIQKLKIFVNENNSFLIVLFSFEKEEKFVKKREKEKIDENREKNTKKIKLEEKLTLKRELLISFSKKSINLSTKDFLKKFEEKMSFEKIPILPNNIFDKDEFVMCHFDQKENKHGRKVVLPAVEKFLGDENIL